VNSGSGCIFKVELTGYKTVFWKNNDMTRLALKKLKNYYGKL
jgi:hypothetical protein